MSQHGRGYCPGCKAEYFNRCKPPKCGMCGYALGQSNRRPRNTSTLLEPFKYLKASLV